MVREVSAETAAGLVVLAWRSDGDGLHLRVRGQSDEVRLRCRCDRRHWIIREQFVPEGARLLLRCHNCGMTRDYLLEGATLPTR